MDVNSHFLDSGAYSQKTEGIEYSRKRGRGRWDFFKTKRFQRYMDSYAGFVKKYSKAIDFYANLDVCENPELTWRNQKYLEKKHGLHPIPVIHPGTNLKWVNFYLERGHTYIGIGGALGGRERIGWLDRCFNRICDTPNHLPKAKVHGFAVGGFNRLLRYPWYSVDTTAWARLAGLGSVFVPRKRKGKFVFNIPPLRVKISLENPAQKESGKHYLTLSEREREIVVDWLQIIGIPLGVVNKKKEIIEKGVINHSSPRRIANLLFFERLSANLPPWPQPFHCGRDGLL